MKHNVEFNEALELVLSSINRPLGKDLVDVRQSLWHTCAENVKAKYDVPNYDNSAMDGYAIRSKDTKHATARKPVELKVIGELPAGKAVRLKIAPGECVSVMTGSCLPLGADAVIEKESVKVESNIVKIFSPVEPKRNIRFRGEDVKKSEVVIHKGSFITPAVLGMLISCGYDKVKVYIKPKVGVIATGDELVDVGEKVSYGTVRNVNSYTLSGLLETYHFIPINYGIVKDDYKQLKSVVTKALKNCDLVLISGGVSKGDYDFVRPVLLELGVKPIFWQVKQRPGKPVFFGVYHNDGKKLPVFGVPGNVVSNYIVFEMLIKPLLMKLEGRNVKEQFYSAVSLETIQKKRGLRYFLRGIVEYINGRFYVRTTGPQGSGILKSLVYGNCIIILEEDKDKICKGDLVTVKIL